MTGTFNHCWCYLLPHLAKTLELDERSMQPFAYEPVPKTSVISTSLNSNYQIVEPNGLCACSSDPSVACCALLCPCVLWGRTMRFTQGKPINSTYNLMCVGYTLLSQLIPGASCLLSCLSQSEVDRRRVASNNIQKKRTGAVTICCKATCCGCCSMAQDYMDVRDGVLDNPWQSTAAQPVNTRFDYDINNMRP